VRQHKASRTAPEMVTLTCANPACGEPFEREARVFRYQISQGQSEFYCCPGCGNVARYRNATEEVTVFADTQPGTMPQPFVPENPFEAVVALEYIRATIVCQEAAKMNDDETWAESHAESRLASRLLARFRSLSEVPEEVPA
jgi:hypothetical protein